VSETGALVSDASWNKLLHHNDLIPRPFDHIAKSIIMQRLVVIVFQTRRKWVNDVSLPLASYLHCKLWNVCGHAYYLVSGNYWCHQWRGDHLSWCPANARNFESCTYAKRHLQAHVLGCFHPRRIQKRHRRRICVTAILIIRLFKNMFQLQDWAIQYDGKVTMYFDWVNIHGLYEDTNSKFVLEGWKNHRKQYSM
jgi:hypothetical protein